MSRKLLLHMLIILLVSAGMASADLVAHWSLDDGSGDVAVDGTGNGHDGALIDGPQWAEGLYGGGLSFGGSPAKVDVPYSADLNPEEFSVSVWAYPDPSGSGHRSPVTARDDFPTAGYIIYVEPGNTWQFWIGNGTNWTPTQGPDAVLGEWTHVTGTYKDGNNKIYINGELSGEATGTVNLNTQRPLRIGAGQTDGPGNYFWVGLIDDVAVFNTELSQAEVQKALLGLGAKELAAKPNPETGIDDVLRDTMLSWDPGAYAVKHDIYVGDSFEDVNAATVPTAAGLDVNSFDPGRLEFGKTYYWRVDEVNGTPDQTVFKGDVWSFTAEPYSIQIAGSDIMATASSSSNEFSLPEKTLDGSGLGEDESHDIQSETMWFTAMGEMDPWIQYEFDGVKKLDVMKVWNSNSGAEGFIGYGAKEVQIEYSTDGETWETLEGATELSRAPGLPTYNQYDAIDFGGAAAKVVRIKIQSNWGGFMQAYSIAEAQFYMIPASARTPDPASGSVDILPNAVVSWRAGREAAQSTVYVSTDPNEVAAGTAPSATSNTNSINLSAFDCELGQTYYWRVDEVNEAEATSVWAGPVWSLSTVGAVIVDDFESYGNDSPNRPFQAWLDGIGYSADEFFSVGYGGNGTDAAIGHDIWSGASEHYNGDIMETGRTIAGSDQSMPFYYSNSGAVASEAKRTFAVSQDWTVGGAKLLSIMFFGEADNTGTLYVKINGTKVTYTLDPTDIANRTWKTWIIDLAAEGINAQSVTTLAIGMDGNGATGMLLIDDITLRQTPPEPVETVSLVNDFDSLAVGSSMHDVPGWEGWYGGAQYGAKVVNTVAYSGTNSLEIVGTRDDVVPNWPLVENGVYVASVMQYVPSSSTTGLMYFGPLSTYGANSSTWLGTLLTNCSTGMVYVNELTGGRTEAPLLRNQWVELRVVMNFDADACDFYYGDTFLGTLPCPSAMGFDIWPDDNVDVLYYDDFSFQAQ